MEPSKSGYAIPVKTGPKELKFKVQPWNHQLEGMRRARHLANFAFLFEVGTGKTMTAINTLRQKYTDEKRLMRTLILTPPITLRNWEKEWAMHSDIPPDRIHVLDGPGTKRRMIVEELMATGKGCIFITNYETLLMEAVMVQLFKWGVEVLVCDEAHRLKNMTAKRTKQAIKVADTTKVRINLTGTPVLNSPLDIFAQWRVLDKGETFGTNFFIFRAQYFDDKNADMPAAKHFPNWQPRPGSEREIHKLIQRYSMSVKKKDCLDLPPLVKKELFVELGIEQKRLYNEMRKDFIAYMKGGAVVATLAITKALRLMEICSGFATVEHHPDGEAPTKTKVRLQDNPRAVALAELLAELSSEHKIIIWAVFKENYETIRQVCRELQLEFVEVHGEVSQKDKMAAVDRFNNDPRCRVFFGHPRSGGIGINLVVSDISIVYSRGFSLEDDIQSEARNYRGGSEIHQHVTRIDLVAKDTIDEEITKRLSLKQGISAAIIDDVARTI